MKPTESTSTGIEVLITVRGEQYFEEADPDATELMTEGVLLPTAEGLVLRYEESELTGMTGTTTTFEIRGRQVILTRSGSVNSQMVFEHGVQHTSLYETLYGELTVDISTSLLENHMTERGGTLEIRYSIAIEHSVTGRNCFYITVKEK
ncbi:DUF1934 domain-containing protein [Oscillibacter sp. MSJ-2]|uniref:DUF1934 domain-containing protein n=1 Tax=Dysosmobacter acutus TaxID=2841504 RepID=A0ABS6FC67_9FIRM|nr:DUF1934 domain-containing protein [Dysosmobacter acutus]MBU5627856.1 DUF1934 domain-containing protein [Dysosmobacter acutus]